jgi:maleylacetate reductase
MNCASISLSRAAPAPESLRRASSVFSNRKQWLTGWVGRVGEPRGDANHLSSAAPDGQWSDEVRFSPLQPFLFEIARLKVIFGRGSVSKAGDELAASGIERALVIASASHTQIVNELGQRCAGLYDDIVQHVPAQTAVKAANHARALGADGCLAIGGGSAIGLAKAIALETGLPFIAIPTTYSGSEMTAIWGITADGVKRAVIYDSQLFRTLPPKIAGPSGLNAMAHAVEGLYAQNANPIMSTLAEAAVDALATGLPAVCEEPSNLDAQDQVLYGGCLAGILLNSVGMSLHHKLCHTLGGAFNMPHAETHSVVLPYAAAFNLPAAPDANARLKKVLRSENIGRTLHELGRRVGAPQSLAALGLKYDDLDRASEIAISSPYANPRPITRGAIRALLEDAYRGAMPRSYD